MPLKEMTLEQIFAERPDLKALTINSNGPTLESLQKTVEDLTTKNETLESEKKALDFKSTVEAEISASGLAADSISEPFRKSLFATESKDERDALIEDRKSVFESVDEPGKGKGTQA